MPAQVPRYEERRPNKTPITDLQALLVWAPRASPVVKHGLEIWLGIDKVHHAGSQDKASNTKVAESLKQFGRTPLRKQATSTFSVPS